jgi:endonuclease III
MSIYTKPPQVSRRAVIAWREQVVSHLSRYLGVRLARKQTARVETELRRIAGLLHRAYHTAHLGNLREPTAEFVYIILSRKTRESAYRAAFDRLRAEGSWLHIASFRPNQLARFVRGGGLEQKKVAALQHGLRAIEKRFGRVDLSEARTLNDEDLFEFLTGLPEVGPKSARCIMLYAFGRPVFPVDAHVGRVLARLDVMRPVVGDLLHIDHKQRQERLANAIPPDLRYALHVNLIALGRDVCVARRPRCRECPLLKQCAHAKGETVRRSPDW